jgi:diguanylate cyclase
VAGDQVLQWVARRLKDLLRAVDIIGRHGGDEFILLLPETGIENARIAANRICLYFSEAELEVAGDKINLGFHIGMTAYEKDLPVDVFIQRAERALEKSQQSITNHVVVWEK